MDSANLNSAEQKKKELNSVEIIKGKIGYLLTDFSQGDVCKVSTEAIECLLKALKAMGKEHCITEYNVNNGKKESKCRVINFGGKMIMIKSDDTESEMRKIQTDSFMFELPSDSVKLEEIPSTINVNTEYGLESFFRDTNKAAAPGLLPISMAQEVRPLVVCNDGFSLSIQASMAHYCNPRENNRTDYTSVEIGSLEEVVSELEEYMEPGSDRKNYKKVVFGYVPRELIEEILRKHGGINKEKTLSESYLERIKRVEEGLKAANGNMGEMQNLASLFEKLTKGKNSDGR